MVGFEVEAIALGLGPCHAQRWPTPLSHLESNDHAGSSEPGAARLKLIAERRMRLVCNGTEDTTEEAP